jgi:protein-L-isoaspartate(D-aspartate) O-methyltransferase
LTTAEDRQAIARRRMVERQIAARGVRDPRVLRAMGFVPRERFVPEQERSRAYSDSPLPIGGGQTISQPYIVAFVSEALELSHGDRVLEIGAGSGYAAAVLAAMGAEVVTVERDPVLAGRARSALEQAGYTGVRVVDGDGSLGWPPGAPYDAISVTAAAPTIPVALTDQLADGGRMVIPVGGFAEGQRLVRIRRSGGGELRREELLAVRFVPLVGEQGWAPEER